MSGPTTSTAYHYSKSVSPSACNVGAFEQSRALQRRWVSSQLPPPPSRRRAAPSARGTSLRAVSLFGFGSKPAPTSQQAASFQDNSGSVLIPFTPVQKTKDYSLRLYSAYPVAEVEYFRRDEGFLMLGSYMSGSNAAEARCRETQPVVMCYPPEGQKKMQIYISLRGGSGGTTADDELGSSLPPAPNNTDVTLGVAGGEVVATRQFEGNATQEACERCRKQLVAALERDGVQLAEAEAGGYFRLAQYGPLHSLSTRVNEIWLAVKLG